VEKEFGSRVEKENREILWQRSARESMPIKIRMVYKGSSSFVPNIMNHLSKTFLFYLFSINSMGKSYYIKSYYMLQYMMSQEFSWECK